MSYDEEDGGYADGFKMSGYDDDTEDPLEIPEELDFGLDEEDPDKDG